jgi:hypothetical protein
MAEEPMDEQYFCSAVDDLDDDLESEEEDE